LEKRRRYLEEYPNSVAGEMTYEMIDIDEARFELESADRKYGKVAREFRCNLRGKYTKGEPGSNLIMAISGNGNNPYSFHGQYTEEVLIFGGFILS
jgi:hypothetical protein